MLKVGLNIHDAFTFSPTPPLKSNTIKVRETMKSERATNPISTMRNRITTSIFIAVVLMVVTWITFNSLMNQLVKSLRKVIK